MKKILLAVSIVFLFVCATGNKHIKIPWQGKMQTIPGKIECEFYDEGGEGIAYHDTDSINNGSGKLNPANGDYLNEFRKKEGVDISYTKPGNIDDNPFNKVKPEMKSLYVGWTQPGEWINYTVNVKETGKYTVALQYTANGNGIIAIDVDGKRSADSLFISSTNNAQDTVAWRQWHHWNHIEKLCEINLNKGKHVLRLHILTNGNMNFDYLDFSPLF